MGGNNLNGQFVLYMYVPNFIETQYEPLLVLVDGINSSYLSDLKTFNNEIVYIERTDFGDNYLKKIYMQDGNLKLKSLLYRENDFNNHLLSLDVSKIFTGNGIYYVNTDIYRGLVINDTQNNPIFYGDDVYYLDDENNLFSSALRNDLEFNYFKDGDNHLLDVDVISRLDNLYFSSGETLYISDYREENGEFRLYLPNDYKKTFDSSITGLHPISLSEMGVFLQDSIWYVQRMDDIYYATKSKLELGIKFGSDIITSYDGSRIVFPTERGIVTLSYQDFVASTDQVLTFLSDAIHLQMREFCKQPVKLFKNDYWIIVYRQDSNEFYILDSRNNSWWFWSIPVNVKKLLKYDDNSLLLSNDNNFYRFDESNENYFDYDGKRKQIDWHLESQKLHLSQINNYKHIVNMTFNSVIDTQPYLTFFLDVKNYRKQIDEGKTENLSYSVENLRTYVQRLNYFKVNEFQYKLYSDNQDRYPLPLSLSSISIKYKMQGQVR